MKLVKSLLLGSAAGLATVVAAQAADLPTRKAAPVEYVRVCDAYGAGFFFIPGTDTCLRVGGLVLAQFGVQPDSANYSISPPVGGAIAAIPAGLTGGVGGVVGNVPGATTYKPITGREIFGYNATGRVELDARTQSPFGTVRTFIRVTSQYGSSANYTTGSLQTAFGNNLANSQGGPTVSKEVTYLDKAFIQFAGITAGRVQSFFDFYADAINYASLRGSNNTTWAAAYTFTFGGGFSATAAIEDTASHRGDIGNVAGGTFTTIGTVGAAGAIASPATGNGLTALAGQAKMPDIIGNLRWDQPWGAAQLSGAVHYIKANLFASADVTSGQSGAPTGYPYSLNSTSQIGFAVQGGLQFNLPMLGAGDKLWLQATYARGAIGYVQGNNLAFTQGVNATSNYGRGVFRSNNSVGWTAADDVDCVFNYTGTCDKSSAYVLLAALKHYWTPTVSSGLFGSYYNVHYSSNSTTPINPYFGAGGTAAASVGISNYQDVRVGTNLVWTPVKNFDIGAEFTYARYITQRPFGLAPDITLRSVGLPAFQGTTSQYLGSVRMIRAF